MLDEVLEKWPTTPVSALGYGVGMFVGSLVSLLLLISGLGTFILSLVSNFQPFLKLLLAAVLVVTLVGAAGAVAGAFGGYVLSRKLGVQNRRRFIWRSGASLFAATAIMIIPAVAIVIVVGFMNDDLELSVGKLPAVFGFIGLLYGAIAGLFIGLLIAGLRQTLGPLLATTMGFAAGGALLGLGIHLLFRFSLDNRIVELLILQFFLFLFGAMGGGGIGVAFRYVDRDRTLLPPTRGWRIFRNVALAILLLMTISAVAKLINTLTVTQPDLAEKVVLPTVGTAWTFADEGVPVGAGASKPAIAVGQDGSVVVAWTDSSSSGPGVYYAQMAAGESTWGEPVLVADSPAPTPETPAVTVDENGNVHVVWAATDSASGGNRLQYSRCAVDACSPATSLSDLLASSCPGEDGSVQGEGNFAVGTDNAGEVLVTWAGAEQVPHIRIDSQNGVAGAQVDCLAPAENLQEAGAITVASNGPDSFTVAMNVAGEGEETLIVEWNFQGGELAGQATMINGGESAELFVDAQSNLHAAWCSETGAVQYLDPAGNVTETEFPRCIGRPSLAQDAEGKLHLIWYSDQVRRVTGDVVSGSFLYEQIKNEDGWTEPAIVARPPAADSVVLTSDRNGKLHMAWTTDSTIEYGSTAPYLCDGLPQTPIARIVYETVRQEKFRPADDPVPYCHNRFERIVFTPNAVAPEVDQPDNPNAAFDDVASLIKSARYEALFATMQWDAPNENGGPGATLAEAVAELYENVRNHPEQYPRGMTVRILLGNVPDLAIFEPTTQIYHVFQDLADAGVTEMRNDEIGWRLEIADYGGAWPHMHSKFAVVDGREAIAGGFNFGFLHLPKDHPSGLGYDMSDKGLEVAGPVAQAMVAAYDDLWRGSDLYSCSRFPPPLPRLEFLWCDVTATPTDHPPEVLRFADNAGDTTAFALDHTSKLHESDEAILAAIGSAQRTIDLAEVNFSLDTICLAAVLLANLCSSDESVPPYMLALLEAIEERDVHVRVIVESTAFNGFENRIGIEWLASELEQIGKRDNVEFKFYNGKMHDKALLIDDEFLIIGSQNFHYSAWGSPSLTEYNLATDDSQAVADFLNEYEFHWEQGFPFEE